MNLVSEGIAGTLESSDALIKVKPNRNAGIDIHLQSVVEKRYGTQIRRVIRACLERLNISDALVEVNDKGALDCTIEARLETALFRAANVTTYPWEEL